MISDPLHFEFSDAEWNEIADLLKLEGIKRILFRAQFEAEMRMAVVDVHWSNVDLKEKKKSVLLVLAAIQNLESVLQEHGGAVDEYEGFPPEEEDASTSVSLKTPLTSAKLRVNEALSELERFKPARGGPDGKQKLTLARNMALKNALLWWKYAHRSIPALQAQDKAGALDRYLNIVMKCFSNRIDFDGWSYSTIKSAAQKISDTLKSK